MRASSLRPRALLPAAAALLLALPLAAQQGEPVRGTLTGRVVDASTGAPMRGVSVRVTSMRRETVTDSTGRFVLARLPRTELRVSASRLGYTEMIQTVEVAAENAPLEIGLTPQPLVLERVQVMTDRMAARRKAVPVSVRAISEDEIALTGASRVTNLVSRYAYFEPCRGAIGRTECVYRRGKPYGISVYIDEIPAMGGLAQLDSYGTQDFYLIEVYQRGTMIRAYTHDFMDRLARGGRTLDPAIWSPLAIY